jgi:hypothetical protein
MISSFLLPVKYKNLMVGLTVRSDTLGSARKGLAQNNYRLVDLHRLSIFETNVIYRSADPSEGY